MTVRKNVEYGLRVRKMPARERQAKVDEALSLVRMSGYGERYPGELSGGQQQRVALARVLVVEPDILLLDEPLSNLDAKLRIEMRDEIRRIHEETGITFLYVTHDQKEALSMADRIVVMNEGRIEQIGTPREIYSAPKNRFVATFLGRMNAISGKVEQDARRRDCRPHGCRGNKNKQTGARVRDRAGGGMPHPAGGDAHFTGKPGYLRNGERAEGHRRRGGLPRRG